MLDFCRDRVENRTPTILNIFGRVRLINTSDQFAVRLNQYFILFRDD